MSFFIKAQYPAKQNMLEYIPITIRANESVVPSINAPMFTKLAKSATPKGRYLHQAKYIDNICTILPPTKSKNNENPVAIERERNIAESAKVNNTYTIISRKSSPNTISVFNTAGTYNIVLLVQSISLASIPVKPKYIPIKIKFNTKVVTESDKP